MFYYKKWDKFCTDISNLNIATIRAKDVLKNQKQTQFIVLKHDVETNPAKALMLAQIEKKHGIIGSFYVQAYLLKNDSNIKILKEIKELGHEVSYHYDVLDANNGDFIKANLDFKINLEKFNACGFKIETVCQHGNPVKKRIGYTSNRDFFRDKSIAQQYSSIADIVVNFKEKSGKNYLYISDVGYSWNIILNPENNDLIKDTSDIPIKNFSNILELLKKGESIILSTHPHRWEKSKTCIYFKIGLYNIVRYFVSLISKVPLFKDILDRFYYLAKKI